MRPFGTLTTWARRSLGADQLGASQPHTPRSTKTGAASAGTALPHSLRLNALGQAVEPGHRLRLALTPTYWPSIWPSPVPVELTVFTGDPIRLTLPVRSPRAADDVLPRSVSPESAPPLATDSERSTSAAAP